MSRVLKKRARVVLGFYVVFIKWYLKIKHSSYAEISLEEEEIKRVEDASV